MFGVMLTDAVRWGLVVAAKIWALALGIGAPILVLGAIGKLLGADKNEKKDK